MASSARWTAEDFRRNARSWTLEGDAKLLEYMQTISENLEQRAQNANSKMTDMVLNLQETNVSLENVTNKLSALQHSQFVENRVYEEDETIANISEVPVETLNDTEQYDPIETLTTVLKNSIDMMEKCYQKVSIDVEDSDDEEGLSKSIVYKPNNFFEQNPLPHIIGSREWKEKWHIGLCDTDEDYSDEENKDEYSDTSENVSLSASLPSNAPTISESESSVWGLHHAPNIKRPTIYSPSSEEEASSNTLTSKTSSDEVQKLRNNREVIPPPQVLPPHVERYYIHKSKEKGLFDESSEESEQENFNSKSQPKIVQQVVNKDKVINTISNIFNDEPPELDEVDRKDENENTQLFYESDTEVNKHSKTQNHSKNIEEKFSNIRKKPVNLFDDDDFDSFMKELDKKTSEKLNQNYTEKNVTNLFDDNNGEEKEPAIAPPVPVMETNTTEAVLRNTNENKKSLFDSELEDNIFENIINKGKNIGPTAKTKMRNLFDDESSDDDFESIFKTSSTGAKNVQNKETDSKINNVENFTVTANNSKIDISPNISKSIDENSLKSNKTQPIFYDEPPKDDDIFNNIKQQVEVSKTVSPAKLERNEYKEEPPRRLNLSDDVFDEDDNLFRSSKSRPVPAPRAVVDLNHKDNLPDSDIRSKSEETKAPVSPVLSISKEKSIINVVEPVKENIRTESKDISENLFKEDIFNNNENVDKIPYEINIPETVNDNTSKSDGVNQPANISSSIFFDNEPPDDNDDILNISKTQSKVEFNDSDTLTLQDEGIESRIPGNNSISSENSATVQNDTQEKSQTIPVASKLKLPSLFDDELSDDEDFLFSKSNKSNPHNSGYLQGEKIEKSDVLEENNSGSLENSNENDPVFLKVNVNKVNILMQPENNLEASNTSEHIQNIFKHNIDTDLSRKVESSNNFVRDSNNYEESYLQGDHSDNNHSNKLTLSTEKETQKSHDNQLYEDNVSGNTILKDTEISLDNSRASTSIYSAINLFQDIPPEDDFQSPTDVKRLHNIFYDDFAETIPTTGNYPQKQSANYFFSDEPPPDSFDDDTIDEPENEITEIPSTPPNDKVIINENVESESVESFVKSKEAVISPDQSELDNKSLSVTELIKKAGTDQAYSKPKTSFPIPKKLNTNLDINVAALIPGAKRPNKLEKQLSVEKDERMSGKSDVTEEVEDFTTPPTNNINYISSQSNPDSNRLQSLNKTRAKIQSKRRPSTRRARQESYRNSLISDVIDGSDDEITDTNTTESVEEITLPPDSTNNELQTSNFLSQNIVNQSVQSALAHEDSNVNQTIDDDWLIRSTKKEAPISTSSRSTDEHITKALSATGFSEESDEDLFASSVIPSVPKVVPSFKEEKPKTVLKSSTKTSKSIFPDDSDDDLFGNPQNRQVSNENLTAIPKPKTGPPAKIFSSDDDDDDLFSKSFKSAKKADSKPEKNVPKKLSVPSSSNLFGDDDDDDDLFGSAVAKKKGITRVVNVPKKTEKKDPPGNSTADNPLADLLSG